MSAGLLAWLHGEQIRAAVPEQVLAVARFELLAGESGGLARTFDELGPSERELARREDPKPPSRRWITGFSWFPFTFGPQVNDAKVEGALWGRLGQGSPGSSAGRLGRARRDSPGALRSVVTDRRFLLLELPDPGSGSPARIVAEVPREDVTSARWRPRFPQPGRVVLTFADGSGLAPALSLLWPGAARRAVSALRGPAPRKTVGRGEL